MTQFRPCIDLHEGKVKQIVGGTLTDRGAKENFTSSFSSEYYAKLYRDQNLTGGHVIALGPGNEEAALNALQAWPNGLQFGGGVTLENAEKFIKAGASHVIVTSWLFEKGQFSFNRLSQLVDNIGKENLVLDLSCRKRNNSWFIATNRWQTITDLEISEKTICELENYCDEFLIHAADVEGLQNGIDEPLIAKLSQFTSIPTTYAGGARELWDLERVKELSRGKIDLTIGSALDVFGGSGVTLEECVVWNKKQS